jgi:hypothetical protein
MDLELIVLSMKRARDLIQLAGAALTCRGAGINAKAQPARFLGATGWAVVGNPLEGCQNGNGPAL